MALECVSFQVGDLPCMVLGDGSGTLKEENISRIFTKDADRMLAAFRTLSVPLTLSRNILCVQTAGKRVLVDSGIGHLDPTDPGKLLDTLRAESIAPESIDTVIVSHFHLYHIGRLLCIERN